MRLEAAFSAGGNTWRLSELALPLDLDTIIPGEGAWEIEIGFGKGRYLLERARAHPDRRFLGLEVVSKYYRYLKRRGERSRLSNLLLVRGEALYLLSTVLPRGFASALHVYFPDPWPKNRHARRRLFDPETLDLVLSVLRPGGKLVFATDFLEYGEHVRKTLSQYPALDVRPHSGPWPDGARTNYESKYIEEGRPIVRLRATLEPDSRLGRLHPEGRDRIRSAITSPHPPNPA